MLRPRKALPVGVVMVVCLAPGCAFVDQKVPLTYNEAVAGVHDGPGTVVGVEMPVCPEFEKTRGGSCIVGNVNNTYGMKTADTITEDSVPQWIADALCTELQAAGFAPEIVDKLPSALARGVSTRVIKVWVEQDPGFWTVGAIGEVQLRVALWQSGQVVQEFDIESKGQGDRSLFGDAGTKQASLRIALEACMKKAIPIIVETLKE